MNVNRFKTLLSFLMLFFLLDDSLTAQSTSFIHIQSENNNAFSVKWKDKTYTSSSTGYLVIPQIPSGEQVLVFGFQDTSLPAYTFSVIMDDKPRGFTLKQSINNTWSLFDMVSFALIKGNEKPKEKEEKPVLVIGKPAEPEKKPVIEIRDTGSKAISTAPPVINTEKPVVRKPIQSAEPPIEKIFDKANTAGIDQVYVVISKGKADTIAVFIPALKEENPKQFAFKAMQELQKTGLSAANMVVVYTDRLKRFTK